ncbi:NAD(P)-binding protein [Aulographum hederae CBS 113979]|uniref:NAD(P)-binding protein n=1 Tax=Aulographum hederae CBS 113979 TaxID=1176131 RepID=A0A6G1GP22_9PEZI|nr:NAD(P)-binding protein [Aulographum hederae CBS 113979]
MEAALKTFFSSPRFAVAGASSDPSKFGHKVLQWYLLHSLPVTPLNPRVPTVSVRSTTYNTVASPASLPSPTETALSVITPPKVTLALLKEAKEAGIKAVWLQPGTFDDEVLEFARQGFEAAIAGMEEGTVGDEGWCVLVDGEDGLRVAGRKWKRGKL